MSVQSEITRIEGDRDTIRNKLEAFGIAISTDGLDTLAAKVNAIPNNGAVSKTLDATTASYDVPAGYHNGSGKVKIELDEKTATPTESEQTITPTSGKVLSKVTVAAIPSDYKDVSGVDATAVDVLAGKTIVGPSGEITGSMPEAQFEVSGAMVKTKSNGAGYVTAGETVGTITTGSALTPATTKQQSAPTFTKSGDVVTATVAETSVSITPNVTAGYISSGTAGIVTMSENSAEYTIPTDTKTANLSMSSGDQTVSMDDKYLTSVTINKPDTLIAENIKKDVNIGGVVGTLSAPNPCVIVPVEASYSSRGDDEGFTPGTVVLGVFGDNEYISDDLYGSGRITTSTRFVRNTLGFGIRVPEGPDDANNSIGYYTDNNPTALFIYPQDGTDRFEEAVDGEGNTFMILPKRNFDGATTIMISSVYISSECVSGDTAILCENGSVKLFKDLAEGDLVAAINPETMELEYVPVTRVGRPKSNKPTEVFTFDNGTQIEAIGNHRFWHKETNSMEYIQDFAIGDHTVDADGNFVALVSKEMLDDGVERTVYFLHNKYHNYFCNGLMSGDRATKVMNFKNA